MQKRQDFSEKEILDILNRELSGINSENCIEICRRKIVIVFPEGMCISCSDKILQQIAELRESHKKCLVVVIPESLHKEFDIYNDAVYHLNNVVFSSDFFEFYRC